jgi:phosphinothricin acetyltransferase
VEGGVEGLIVRDALASDIAAITAIYRPAVLAGTATFELDPPDESEMHSRLLAITGAGHPYLVAEQTGAVVGYAYAGSFRTRPAYRFTVEDSIYLAPPAQRRGVGRRLLSELVHRCEAKGYRQMVAVIGDSANIGSIALHRALGFALCGTLPATGFKLGRWIDTVLMQRPLGAGAATVPLERSR